ncbi:hypothetical protein CGZ60_07880 [Neisseria animalis]|nr:hypothetical protein CGZ60_07880 [Neisseria animalis]
MPCRTMCTVCGFAALSHSYFIRLYMATLHDYKSPYTATPEADKDTVQIDCYAAERAGCRAPATAETVLDKAVQKHRLILQNYEPETGLFHIGLGIDRIGSGE